MYQHKSALSALISETKTALSGCFSFFPSRKGSLLVTGVNNGNRNYDRFKEQAVGSRAITPVNTLTRSGRAGGRVDEDREGLIASNAAAVEAGRISSHFYGLRSASADSRDISAGVREGDRTRISSCGDTA